MCRQECCTPPMHRGFKVLAFAVAALPSMAFASGDGVATGKASSFESCLLTKALVLEPEGTEVREIMAGAERACEDATDGLTNADVDGATQRVRLAVMQQRTNARNLLRRGRAE